MDKDKKKLEKRLKKFKERHSIHTDRQKLIPIYINKCHRSLVYLELLNKTIKTIDYPEKMVYILSEFRRKTQGQAILSKEYEEYRCLLSEEIWKNNTIKLKFPKCFYYVYKRNNSLAIDIETRACEVTSGAGGSLYRSPEDIKIKFNNKEYELFWSDHSINRMVERISESTYASFINVAYVIYFLNWFKIIKINNRDYLLIYIESTSDEKCHLLGIAPIDMSGNKMIVKTFLPCEYVSKLNLDKVIDKPSEYSMKAHVLDQGFGSIKPLSKNR